MPDPTTNYVIPLTPPGRGALATLRIEGPHAIQTTQTQFQTPDGRPLSAYPVDRPVVGLFGQSPGERIVVCRRPDNAVELHCHGGFAAVASIQKTFEAAGFQPLAWQEWVNQNSVDPIAADAFRALANARTERAAAILLDQYHGALSRALDDIRQAIDCGDRESARRQIELLLSRAPCGLHLVDPWRVVLAGPVNVGKSSLINALAGFDRSIVHPAPGTTRDAVTLSTATDGWPVELCDTAGLRQTDHAVEQAGIDFARQRIARADLVILLFDLSKTWSAEDQKLVDRHPGALLVHNKSDLEASADNRPAGLVISVLHNQGIAALIEAIAKRLVALPPQAGQAVPFTIAQVEQIRQWQSEIE